VANYPDGTQRVIFRTTEPHLTQAEMQSLITWTNERMAKKDLHPLMIAAAFVYEFLSIHPYQDGNGRLSRLLTSLLLMKQDYQFIQYISFENVIESKKEGYYRALIEGQKNRYKKSERIDSWVEFFLESLIILTQRLEAKYETYSKLKTVLNERQENVLEYIKEHNNAQVGELESQLKGYSRNTLKKDLAYLVKEGLILKTGEGRGVRYHAIE
jgi:Fic family protein